MKRLKNLMVSQRGRVAGVIMRGRMSTAVESLSRCKLKLTHPCLLLMP